MTGTPKLMGQDCATYGWAVELGSKGQGKQAVQALSKDEMVLDPSRLCRPGRSSLQDSRCRRVNHQATPYVSSTFINRWSQADYLRQPRVSVHLGI